MKILLLNTSEKNGGAAIACNRIMVALNNKGIETKMLVRDKQTNDENIYSTNTSKVEKVINKFRFIWERFIIFTANQFSKKELFKVSISNTGASISKSPIVKNSDIIHLHWINQGFLSIKEIQNLVNLNKPIVWTMHDMWPCTSICHHSYGCNNYKNKCGNCFLLHSSHSNDLSNKIWHKKEFIKHSNINIVTVSHWLKNKAIESSLTKNLTITVIPNVVDTTIFCPQDKMRARKKLLLPNDKKIILMGAAKLNDPIKGFDYLCEALSILIKDRKAENYLLLLFGEIKKDPSFLKRIPIEYKHFGTINNPRDLTTIYAATDITIAPSLYETFGQTLSESMACRRPVISFNNSGQTDIIDHKENGYLAEYQNAADLSAGINWIFENADYERLCKNARQKVVTHFSEEVIAQKYIDLYKNILNPAIN